MIISFLSLGLMGVWCGILALINAAGSSPAEKPAAPRPLEVAEPGPRVVAIPTREERRHSELARALRELWNDIAHGS